MSWTEKLPGHFERPFDTLEIFYQNIGSLGASLGREHYSISAVLRLHFGLAIGDPAVALRHAWKTMRFDFPQLAAIKQASTYIYDTPDAAALESWLASTFMIEPPTTNVTELYASFKPGALATMHYLPHTSEILFHSSHWRIDGVGTVRLLNHFLKALSNPYNTIVFGPESANLSPSLDEALKVPIEASSAAEKAANELITNFVNHAPSVGLPITPDDAGADEAPGATKRCEIQVSLQQTSAIIAACKAHGFSVTTATHAAVISATRKMATANSTARSYASWLAFDLRKYYHDAEASSGKHAVSIYHTGLPAAIQLSTFASHATQLKAIYTRQLDNMDWNVFSFLACYVRKVCELFTQPLPRGTLPPREPNLNSLGIIDRYLQAEHRDTVKVLDFWLGVEVLTQIVMVYVWTWQGRMKLSACYNESFYEEAFVKSFLEEVRGVLVQELNVQVD